MTGVGGRPEVVIEGSNSLEEGWREYGFLYKPGDLNRRPPFVGKWKLISWLNKEAHSHPLIKTDSNKLERRGIKITKMANNLILDNLQKCLVYMYHYT